MEKEMEVEWEMEMDMEIDMQMQIGIAMGVKCVNHPLWASCLCKRCMWHREQCCT